jgi:hypothetical protein
MTHIPDSSSLGSSKAGPFNLGTLQTNGRTKSDADAVADRSHSDPQRPVDREAHSESAPAFPYTSYPVHMIRKVMRNRHGRGSPADLRLLRSERWPT